MTDAPAREPDGWPLVSVILPTRGRPDLVRESIAAVVAQAYPGQIECLVVHDQEPPDEELSKLGTRQHRVMVTACDDDDVWHPDKLASQVERLRREPGLLVVGSGIRLRLPGKVVEWPGRAEHVSYQLLLRNRVKELHSSTLVMRREAFAKVGPYDEQLPRGYAEDYDWVLRAARAGQVGIVTRPLADIRKDGTSWYQGGAENAALALEYMLAKHPDIAASPRGHARILGQIAFARSALGERGPAIRYAAKAVARWPISPYPYIAFMHAATRIHPRYLLRAARLFRRGMA
jgi:cellulose synthase/poly-beta-1,6-N-acetylglucosamine synthase-like glycosyltransferase